MRGDENVEVLGDLPRRGCGFVDDGKRREGGIGLKWERKLKKGKP